MRQVPGRVWDRQTPWRQGSVLDRDTLVAIGALSGDAPDDRVGVVISHDCDLAQDDVAAEPFVEFIVGSANPPPDGNFSWAKSTRTLHLEFNRAGRPALIELCANEKRIVGKGVLAPFDPDESYELTLRHLAVLRDWLAARYRRTAFPDEFNKRLARSGAPGKLKDKLAASGGLISFVYFDLKGQGRAELPAGVPYELSVVLVYSPGKDPMAAADAADAQAAKVHAALTKCLKDPACGIVFKGCFAISEDEVKLSLAELLMRWRLDFITLRAE